MMVIEVQRAANDWIFEREFKSIEVLVAEMLSVTASDVSKFGCDLKATAMIALPGKAIIQPWIGKQVQLSTEPAVHGRKLSASTRRYSETG